MPSLLRLVSFVAVVMSLSNAAIATNEVTVPCPGGMVDSSSAIATALQSLAPGGTVHLEACTYYLADPVVVTGSFHGALKGEGVGQTVLTTFPDEDGIEDVLMVNWISDLDNPGSRGSTLGPTLFHFSLFGPRPNRVAMSDLTVDVADEHPAFGSARAAWFGDALLAIITVEGVEVSTHFDRLELEGSVAAGALCERNVLYGVEIWGELSNWPDQGSDRPMTGQHHVRGSWFENVCTGYNTGAMTRSFVSAVHNRFESPGLTAFLLEGLDKSNTLVTRNEVELSAAGSFGMWLDWSDGAVIVKNRVAGQGAPGILVGSGANYKILNNDFRDLIMPAGSYSIVLGADTSRSLVVGTDPSTVQDDGTNNRVLWPKKKP